MSQSGFYFIFCMKFSWKREQCWLSETFRSWLFPSSSAMALDKLMKLPESYSAEKQESVSFLNTLCSYLEDKYERHRKLFCKVQDLTQMCFYIIMVFIITNLLHQVLSSWSYYLGHYSCAIICQCRVHFQAPLAVLSSFFLCFCSLFSFLNTVVSWGG